MSYKLGRKRDKHVEAKEREREEAQERKMCATVKHFSYKVTCSDHNSNPESLTCELQASKKGKGTCRGKEEWNVGHCKRTSCIKLDERGIITLN